MTEIPLQQHIAPSGEQMTVRDLASCPPPERWHDWVEYDAKAWPRKVEKHYAIIPTICFNCEAACGLMAYVDKETGRVKKFEGNPYHPGSRGRNCAKGPATINQVNDPERILYPLKRTGKRGEGKWERTTWDEVLETFAAKIRSAIIDDRRDEVMYHVGRPGHDGYMERVLGAWGVDGLKVSRVASGNLIRFTYRVTNPAEAAPLNDRNTNPFLYAPRTRAVLSVPAMEKVGPLRQTGALKVGKEYWMAFSNKGNLVKPGDRVNVNVGRFHADGLVVE